MSDGKLTRGSDVVHLESLHPNVSFPIQMATGEVLSSADLTWMAAFGLAPGYSVMSKFGRNPSIDLNDTEHVWTVGNDRAWLAAASTLEAIGGGTDTAAGAGAQAIVVQGLDENFAFVQESIEMNGGSVTDPTTAQFIRVNRAYVSRVGTYGGTNTADITIRLSGGGATQTEILSGQGQTEQTHYSLATGYQALILYAYMTVDSTKTIAGQLFQRPGIDDTVTPFVQGARKLWGLVGTTGGGEKHYHAPPLITGPADIWWEATSGANGTEVEAGFDLLLRST